MDGCFYCGDKESELRPYGPSGADICFPCMDEDPEIEAQAKAVFEVKTDQAGPVAILTPDGPVSLASIAIRVASFSIEAKKKAKKPKKRTSQPAIEPTTEYACRVDVSFSVEFEGDSDKKKLLKKLKDELKIAVGQAVTATTRDLQLTASGFTMQAPNIECAVTDDADASND